MTELDLYKQVSEMNRKLWAQVHAGCSLSGHIKGILWGMGYDYRLARITGTNAETLRRMRYAMKSFKSAYKHFDSEVM